MRTRRRGARPALHQHVLQDRAIDRFHQPRRQQPATRPGAHQPVGRGVMLERAPASGAAGTVDARIGDRRVRIGRGDARLPQQLARQIEAADLGVLVEIAQDVGELQRAAEMVRQLDAGLSSMPKMRTDSRPTALATRSQ